MAIMKFNKRMRESMWIKFLDVKNNVLVFVCFRNAIGRYFVESLDGNFKDSFIFIDGKIVFD